jgi:ribosomal protein S18 acetylase RimI-like enzyme
LKIKEEIINTYIEKYGVDNPFKSNIIKNQIKQTNLQKYGVENPQQNKIIKNKTRKTCLEKYGIDNVLQLERVIQKRNQICLEKYGDEIILRTELGKQKIKQTCLEKYGVENPQQVPEIAEKAHKNSYRKKTYILPSGKELSCQGYEPFALDKLIKEDNILEDDIIPIGFIRSDNILTNQYILSWSIAPDQRGKGYGTKILEIYLQGRTGSFIAEIKPENLASIKMVKKNGFNKSKSVA